MIKHQPAHFLIVISVVIFCQLLNTDGVVWKAAPDEVVNVQQGSNITLRWHYEMEENETFLSSEFVSNNSKSHVLASRYEGESNYNHIYEKGQAKLAISGKNDVTLTIFSAELGSSKSGYCCIVNLDTNKGRTRKKRCVTIYIYALPRITSHTPQLSCKQGNQVKLQCNATGYPEPRVRWIHRDTNKIIATSSMTSLNITGKKSEGSYCCDVKNQFGRKTACTTVKVTEYKPENTTLVHWVSNNTLYIKCNAIASPPPNFFIIRINEEQHNSTRVINTFRNIPTKNNNTVSCIPFNKYGQGSMEEINLPVYVSPKFTSKIPSRYTMTAKKVNITCSATGTPKPNITWTKEKTDKVVSRKEYYEVPFVMCANKTLIFYCHASNAEGSIKSKQIKVQVMTQRSCTVLKSNKETITKEKDLPLIVGILCGILMAICTVVLIFLKKRKGITFQDEKPTDEDPYAEPLDTIVPFVEVVVDKSALPDNDYSNPEELGLRNAANKQRPKEEESPYETLLV